MGDDVTDHDQTSGDGLHPDELPAHENWIARNSKTISTLATVAIPVVIAVVGTIANININNQNNDREYVRLAYGILSANQPSATDQAGCSDVIGAVTATATADTTTITPTAPTAETIDELRSLLRRDVEEIEGFEEIRENSTIALRNYGLDLLVATTPVALSLDQYVALLCGKVNLPVSAAVADGETATVGASGEADTQGDAGRFAAVIEDLREMFEGLEPQGDEKESLPEACIVTVLEEAPTLDGKVVKGELPAVARRSGDETNTEFVKVVTPGGTQEWMELNLSVVLAQEGCEKE